MKWPQRISFSALTIQGHAESAPLDLLTSFIGPISLNKTQSSSYYPQQLLLLDFTSKTSCFLLMLKSGHFRFMIFIHEELVNLKHSHSLWTTVVNQWRNILEII